MPALKTYDLFLSHVWRNSENSDYYRLEKLLKHANNFTWRNYSVPEHDPFERKPDKELRQELDRQIRPVNCFLIISGMYVNYRKWIQEEFEIAKRYRKPIIGIIPQGNERIPVEIQSAAKVMVGWNTDSIVTAVRNWSI